jgi:membrane protease YdiL (CAAX protease family)
VIAEAAQTADETLVVVVALAGVVPLALLFRRRARLQNRPDHFGPVDVGAAIGGAVAAFVVYLLCMILVLGAGEPPEVPLGVFGRWLGIVASLAIVAVADRRLLRRVLRPSAPRARRLGLALWIAWASLPLVFGLLFLEHLLGIEVTQQDSVKDLVERRPGWGYLALFVVVIAPLWEELCFRGALYPALRRAMGPAGAMAATGILFGLIHVSPPLIAPLTVLGVALAGIVEATGSLWPCIVAHAAFNALTVVQVVAFQ